MQPLFYCLFRGFAGMPSLPGPCYHFGNSIVQVLKLRFLCLRPLAPTAIALKGIYWQCIAAMGVGERARERGHNGARFRPLSLTLSPIHLPSKSSRLSDLCRGKWMGARGRIARKSTLLSNILSAIFLKPLAHVLGCKRRHVCAIGFV